MTANHHLDACTRFGHAADGRGVVVGDVVTRSTTVAAAVEFGRGGDAGVNGECGGCAGRSIARFVGGGDGWGVGARRQCCRRNAPSTIRRRSGGEGLTAHDHFDRRSRFGRATDGRGGAVGGVVTHQTAVTTAGQGACRCWCYGSVDGHGATNGCGGVARFIGRGDYWRVAACWQCRRGNAPCTRGGIGCGGQGLTTHHDFDARTRFGCAAKGRGGDFGDVVCG